jgi:hypothetical protein
MFREGHRLFFVSATWQAMNKPVEAAVNRFVLQTLINAPEFSDRRVGSVRKMRWA